MSATSWARPAISLSTITSSGARTRTTKPFAERLLASALDRDGLVVGRRDDQVCGSELGVPKPEDLSTRRSAPHRPALRGETALEVLEAGARAREQQIDVPCEPGGDPVAVGGERTDQHPADAEIIEQAAERLEGVTLHALRFPVRAGARADAPRARLRRHP